MSVCFEHSESGGCRRGYFSRSEITWATFTPDAPAWAASSQNPLDSGFRLTAKTCVRSLAPPLPPAPACAGRRRAGPCGGRSLEMSICFEHSESGGCRRGLLSRSEITWATFTPDAPAWARPRVTPAPSPTAKKPGRAVLQLVGQGQPGGVELDLRAVEQGVVVGGAGGQLVQLVDHLNDVV